MGNDSRDGWDPKDVSGGGSILKTGLARRYKGTPSLLVPLGNVQATGGWHSVFLVAAAMNLLAGARRPLLCFGHCGLRHAAEFATAGRPEARFGSLQAVSAA